MTIQEFLAEATKTLEAHNIATARLDCLVLLEDALSKDRAYLLAHPEAEISHSTEVNLNKKIAQRAAHTPLAYIRGKAEFYGREFAINRHVLVPRPETETMISLLKHLPLPAKPALADIGTGTGCIGITAALELPGSKVILYDIDDYALKLARQNANSLKAKVELFNSNLLQRNPVSDAILANLPYVPDRYSINQAAEHEPKHAIFGGKDGLNLYRQLWEQITALPKQPAFVLTEALPTQHDDMRTIAASSGYKLLEAQDFIQVFVKK